MLYDKFRFYSDKTAFDVDDKMQLSYFCLKFLSSVFFRFAKNVIMKISPG
jgi:hypothetical protein